MHMIWICKSYSRGFSRAEVDEVLAKVDLRTQRCDDRHPTKLQHFSDLLGSTLRALDVLTIFCFTWQCWCFLLFKKRKVWESKRVRVFSKSKIE